MVVGKGSDDVWANALNSILREAGLKQSHPFSGHSKTLNINRQMSTLIAVIERCENNYSAYIESLDGIVATGNTIDEIKGNLLEAIDAFVCACRESGCDIPELLAEDFNVEFRMDVESVLNFYAGIFTKAGLERITGINQKQLWHYANGASKPRRAQVLKIENALHRLGNELISIHL